MLGHERSLHHRFLRIVHGDSLPPVPLADPLGRHPEQAVVVGQLGGPVHLMTTGPPEGSATDPWNPILSPATTDGLEA